PFPTRRSSDLRQRINHEGRRHIYPPIRFIIPFCSRTGYEQENWGLGITSAPLGNNCQEVSGILTTVFGFIASCYNRVSLCMRTGAGECVAQQSTGDEFCSAGCSRK